MPEGRERFALGEAVVLGVDGIADFNALHSRRHDDEVQLYAFDILGPRDRRSGAGRWNIVCSSR